MNVAKASAAFLALFLASCSEPPAPVANSSGKTPEAGATNKDGAKTDDAKVNNNGDVGKEDNGNSQQGNKTIEQNETGFSLEFNEAPAGVTKLVKRVDFKKSGYKKIKYKILSIHPGILTTDPNGNPAGFLSPDVFYQHNYGVVTPLNCDDAAVASKPGEKVFESETTETFISVENAPRYNNMLSQVTICAWGVKEDGSLSAQAVQANWIEDSEVLAPLGATPQITKVDKISNSSTAGDYVHEKRREGGIFLANYQYGQAFQAKYSYVNCTVQLSPMFLFMSDGAGKQGIGLHAYNTIKKEAAGTPCIVRFQLNYNGQTQSYDIDMGAPAW